MLGQPAISLSEADHQAPQRQLLPTEKDATSTQHIHCFILLKCGIGHPFRGRNSSLDIPPGVASIPINQPHRKWAVPIDGRV